MDLVRGIVGMAAIIAIALLFSKNRKAVNWKMVATGLGIQFVLAVFILKGADMAEYWSPLGWPINCFSAGYPVSSSLFLTLQQPVLNSYLVIWLKVPVWREAWVTFLLFRYCQPLSSSHH